MSKTEFLEWLDRHNCRAASVRDYVVDFYSGMIDHRLNRNTTLSYNLRLDIYHVVDNMTGEDLYSGNFKELERLITLAEMNQLNPNPHDQKLDSYTFDGIMYGCKATLYGW